MDCRRENQQLTIDDLQGLTLVLLLLGGAVLLLGGALHMIGTRVLVLVLGGTDGRRESATAGWDGATHWHRQRQHRVIPAAPSQCSRTASPAHADWCR